ncbi:MAG: hypothetical protein RL033_3622 [Pseudomonadota bacterium]
MSRVRSCVRRRFRFVHAPALGGLAACASLACGGEVKSEQKLQHSQSDLTAVAAPAAGQSCEQLLAGFKSALLADVGPRADVARSGDYYYPLYSEVVAAPRGSALPGGAAPGAGSARPRFSGTTQLVPGVDPGDLVKADGDRIYLVHDNSLLVLNAADASSLELAASVPLGSSSPTNLLVHEGRVAVFSTVYDGLPSVSRPVDPYGYPRYFTQLTVVDTNTATPTVLSESYFEGDTYYTDRSGSVVRAFAQQGQLSLDTPPVSYTDIFGVRRSQEDIDRQVDLWVELTTESIEASTIEDYLPERFERVAGVLQSLPVSCSDLLSFPSDGQGLLGRSGLIAVDLAAPAARPTLLPLSGNVQLGAIAESTAVLLQQDYGTSAVPTVTSTLHVFQLQGAQFSYAGSGALSGALSATLGVDEASGVISTVTQRDVYGSDPGGGEPVYLRSSSRVQTLKLEQGQVSLLGESADLPGDYLLGARFDGDRAYVSTNRSNLSNDGLLSVIDLSDPASPTVTGDLELSGQGSLFVPFGSEQLLTLSQRYDSPLGVSTLALEVLDVQDPAAPTLVDELALGNAYSDATYDTRALSLHADENIFALPLQSYDGVSPSSLEVFQLSDGGELTKLGAVVHDQGELSLLECLIYLGYPTDPETLEMMAENPDLAAPLLRDCSYYRFSPVSRGLFRGEELFTVGSAQVTGHALDALAGPPLGRVDLPQAGLSLPVPVSSPVLPVVPESAPASEE